MPLPLLILLPGLDGTGQLFGPFVEACAGAFDTQVVRFPVDEPLGYDALASRVESELPRARPFVLLGESFSGPLALRLAARQPPGLRGLVLCASFVRSPIGAWARLTPWPWIFRASPPRALVDALLTGRDRALTEQVRRALGQVRPQVMVARARAIIELDAGDDLDRCQVPLLYLRATRDRLVPRRCAEEVVARHPATTLTPIDGPHLLLQARAHEARQALVQLLPNRRARNGA